MRRILFALALLLAPEVASAASRYVAASGSWASTATWSDASCAGATGASVPGAADDVILCPDKTVTVPCNTTAALTSLTDDASWTPTSAGGLVADGSGCTAGQVPTFAFTNTSTTANVLLDGMGSAATFKLVGRSVTTDAPWGEPSDLTDNCGGADKTANGVTWASAKNECSKYTWANKPYSNSVPAGLSGLALGNLVWFTSGGYRNNWATVTAATATTLTIGYGDPNDAFGTQSTMPAITGSSSTSIEVPMDVSLTAWDVSNPTRIVASIQSGALSALPGASNGSGQRAGWCLVTSTATTPAGSGRFYRIAGSVDGVAGTDSLILDPWETVAAADTLAGYLAAGSNAWIAPCVKPGDRWYSFEPVVWKPATAGTHLLSTNWLAGACPTLTRVLMPNITPADQGPAGTEAWADMTNPAIGFYGQSGCTIAGPWAIGPIREVGVHGYVAEIKAVNGMTISNTSIQGSYWYTSPSDTVFHGFAFYDDAGLVFDSVNVSFINNEAFYLHQETEEASNADSPFEGMGLTIRHSTIHDIFHKVGLSDSGSAIDVMGTTHTAGSFTFAIFDNLIYNVVRIGITGLSGAQPYSLVAHSNVIGPIHRMGELDTIVARAIHLGTATGGVTADTFAANNVVLSTVDYNGSTVAQPVAISGVNTAYNYIGEWGAGIQHSATSGLSTSHYGDLIEAAGSVAATSILTTSTSVYGVVYDRNDSVIGTQIVRDLTIRRLCSLLGQRFAGIQALGEVTPPGTELEIHYTHNTFGLYCPEAAAATPTAYSAGIYHQNRGALEKLTAGSDISNNLFVTGDNTASSTFKAFPVYLYDGLTSTHDGLVGNISFTLGKNLCSQCDIGGSVCGSLGSGAECCRNCSNGTGNPYTFNQTGQNMERFSPIRRMESLGIRSVTDTRLVRGSPAYSFTAASDHIGARYSGIVSYSQAMADAGIPESWLYQRGDSDDEPDRDVLPQDLKFLAPTGRYSSGWLPRAF